MTPHVVLVAVEVSCDPREEEALATLATQWAQELRFSRVMPHAETRDARAVVAPGTLATLTEMLRVAHDKVTT